VDKAYLTDVAGMISLGTTWGPFVGRVEHVVQRNITNETMERNLDMSK